MTARNFVIGVYVVFMMVIAGVMGWDNSMAAGASTPSKAYFAGGCFWCMEEAFEKVDGVTSVVSGYMGGTVANPTYEQVSDGKTGHAESVEVTYDPAKVSYRKLLEAFWHNVDPLTPDAQFCDHGNQYRAEIFPSTPDEQKSAEDSKKTLELSQRFPAPIVTRISPAATFYPAEDYHQDFYKKNPVRYKFYKFNCGRAQRLEELWEKP